MKLLILSILAAIALSACASQKLGGPYYQCGNCMCSTDGQGRYCN